MVVTAQLPWRQFLRRKPPKSSTIVQFYYLSRQLTHSIVLKPENAHQVLQSTDWDISVPTMYVIHGYVNNHRSDINVEIASAVLENSNWNVFLLDWGNVAKKFYLETKKSIKNVAKELGNFILATNQSHDLITIVGHSLGAHLGGLASRFLNGTIQQIVALDPAGKPTFFPLKIPLV